MNLNLPRWAAACLMLCTAPTSPATPPPQLAAAAPDQAVPLRVLLRGRAVAVVLERGVQQVVLEERASQGWRPVGVSHVLPGAPRVAVFRLTRDTPADQLRALGYRALKFPARFRQGARSFDRPDVSGGALMSPALPRVLGGQVVNLAAAVSPATLQAATDAALPAVLESDIWQTSGDRLYFFNQYRGLQVLDLTDPAQPVRLGSLRLPACGEQMFLLDAEGSHVALLGRSNDRARLGQAAVWLIRVTDGIPALIQELPLEGTVTDSRLVGSTLHVLCQVWPQSGGGVAGPARTTAAPGPEAVLTSLDLADLAAPATLGTLRFPAENAVLQAAEGHLLVACSTWDRSTRALHLVRAEGAPVRLKTFTTRGQVVDKFKMGVVNGAVVAVTQDMQDWARRQTWVETFPMAGGAVTPLAALELEGARGESLHATRFDGRRLYVVTFREVDPLFVLDLENPAAPVLSGVLEVPGWSTYLEPLGDRLLAVGVEDGRVTVSLFSVEDVTAPTLLSRVFLGQEGMPSWSEANYDEKAVAHLPERGVVMVPFQAWQGQGGMRSAVQVVHVDGAALALGPVIDHAFNPRRGGMMGDFFVSISGQELLVHDLQSALAGEPVVRLPLAWRVDRVVPVGDYLVQVEDGPQPPGLPGRRFFTLRSAALADQATLRVSLASDPDALVDQVSLGAGQVLGMAQQGSRLYLAQWGQDTEGSPGLRTRVLELSSTPPVVREVAAVFHPWPAQAATTIQSGAEALWPAPERLVWRLSPQQEWLVWLDCVLPGRLVVPPGSVARPHTGGAQVAGASIIRPGLVPVTAARPTAVFCPVEITAAGPAAGPVLVVEEEGQTTGLSGTLCQGGFLFYSHDLPVQPPQPVRPAVRGASARPLRPLVYAPRVASWLRVIDWRAPSPVVRSPVSIPGQLLSVAQADAQGAVLLTQGDLQIARDRAPARVVHASAYDGASAWQLDRYITSTPFHTAAAADGTLLYLARENGTVVGVGYDAVTGRLSQATTWGLAQPPALLRVAAGHLLASSAGCLEIASIRRGSGVLTPLASFDTPADLWLRVDRAIFTSVLDLWVPAGDYGVEFLQHAQISP